MISVAKHILPLCFEDRALYTLEDLGPKRFPMWRKALLELALKADPHILRKYERNAQSGKFWPTGTTTTTGMQTVRWMRFDDNILMGLQVYLVNRLGSLLNG
jgi:hypothetical protein